MSNNIAIMDDMAWQPLPNSMRFPVIRRQVPSSIRNSETITLTMSNHTFKPKRESIYILDKKAQKWKLVYLDEEKVDEKVIEI